MTCGDTALSGRFTPTPIQIDGVDICALIRLNNLRLSTLGMKFAFFTGFDQFPATFLFFDLSTKGIAMKTGTPFRLKSHRLVAAASLALCSAIASAMPAVLSFSGGSNFPAFNGTNQTIGWQFTVAAGNGVTVNQLGWWDSTPATPLAQTHQVGIWNLAGVLLGSTTVLTNSALSGEFRYEDVTPIVLAAGSSYLIGGSVTSPFSDVYSVPGALAMDSMIEFDGAARNGSAQGFSVPTTVTSGNGRFGPNFQFTVNSGNSVPEPGTAWILLTGLGLLGVRSLRARHLPR